MPSYPPGTDDDLPPMQQNRFSRTGRAAGSARSAPVGNAQFSRVNNDMETHIHRIEQEAYTSVLRAFKAQSDAISWDKESLITELRKELNITDEEHRELLSKVNADSLIGGIREWRKAGQPKPGHNSVHGPMFSAPVKKQKTSHSAAGAPSQALALPIQPSSSGLKRGSGSDTRGKEAKSISQDDTEWDSMHHAAAAKGLSNGQHKNEFLSSKNGIGKKELVDIEILQTDALLKQADKVFNASRLNPSDVEKAKKLLKDHEQALVDAIAILEGASDVESDGNHQRRTNTRARLS